MLNSSTVWATKVWGVIQEFLHCIFSLIKRESGPIWDHEDNRLRTEYGYTQSVSTWVFILVIEWVPSHRRGKKGITWLFNRAFLTLWGLAPFLSPQVWKTVVATSSSLSTVTPISLGNAWGHHLSRSPLTSLSGIGLENQGSLSGLALVTDPGCLRSFPLLPFISLNWNDQPCQERGPQMKGQCIKTEHNYQLLSFWH